MGRNYYAAAGCQQKEYGDQSSIYDVAESCVHFSIFRHNDVFVKGAGLYSQDIYGKIIQAIIRIVVGSGLKGAVCMGSSIIYEFEKCILLAIINDILDLSKIESGKAELIDADFCLKLWMISTIHCPANWQKNCRDILSGSIRKTS